ncbi:sucrose nonfermenting 4-like protein isoform X1 [Oryza sativa Japonica Group]|nr:sucrose nonfermenting 4-like protein isoform X1 [Oryza sativa Japonica Group]XP_015636727.1 sucrose nonfermenting 4-like protein isoform X1 [Oryza sativa Japonica Group]XP_052152452.1 sucrose nonfermenting 4-like protein isoform X1 [Oryza glaberrima]
MVLRRFAWPYGGQRASFCGSFTGWRECPMGLVGAEFQVVFDLPPGVYQYRFLVDGVWRCDETKPCVRDEYGLISNEVLVDNTHPVVQPETSIRVVSMDEGTILTTQMPPDQLSQNSGVQIAIFRHRVSEILLHNTIYDVVPVSSKIAVLDARLPVKQAFKIMHDEGLSLVPLWDDQQQTVTGMLTASDFVLILRKLQRNIRTLGHEELEMHSVSAWKEAKLQFYGGPDVAAIQRRPLIHVKDSDNLRDVALAIIRNEISSVPIFKPSTDSSGMPLLGLATLPGIVKFICSKLQEQPEGYSFLQNQIVSMPIGTWSPHTGKASNRQLRTSRPSTPLNSCLDLLLEDRVSSIPIVDDNGALLDVYSLSDIMALGKNDVYTRIELEQVTVEHALELQYQVNGRRHCHTCLSTSTFLEVLEQLSAPGVRRVVVIEPRSRFVQGIISLRDAFTFLIG